MSDRVTWVGRVVGTGAVLNVTKLGFKPRVVKLKNVDGLVTAYWNQAMKDGEAVKEVTAGTKSLVTANGITPLANGFRIGTDGDINVDGESIVIEAHD